jgi:Phage capsid family
MTELRVTKEPLTYERRGKNSFHSFFRDWALQEIQPNDKAEARLKAHENELRVEMPKMEARLAKNPEAEYRVNPQRTEGEGFSFAPPLWASELFATAPRPKRVLASLIPSFELPPGASSVNLPRMTTGTEAGTPVDIAPPPNRDILDAAVSAPATTIAGISDVSLQLLEQSPQTAALDFVVMKDLSEAADASLEEKLFTGTGAKNQFTGLLNLATGAGGVSSVTFNSATPKGYEIYGYLGKLGAQLGDARKCPPEAWLMRTARWCALGSSLDLEDLPISTPGHEAIPVPAFTFDDSRPSVAPPILGFPNYLSDACPANLGAGGNQDAIVAIRPSDMVLFESTTKTAVFKEVLSGTLQARFQLHRYASVLWRYPTGIATLTGTGLVVQSEE